MIKAKQISVSNGKVLLGNSSNIASETAYTIPATNGTAGQVLQHDGSGSLVFSNQKTLSDADNNTKIQVEESSDENKIRFDTAGSQRMVITDAGKVGIGIEAPSRMLDISGDIVVRGGDIHGNATGNPAISIDSSTNVTVPNTLTVDGDGSSNGIKLSDGLIEMRTATGNVAQIDMYCEVSNAHKISLKAPAHSEFSGNINFVLPSSQGSNGQYLKTDGNGNTSWGTVSSGSSYSVNVNTPTTPNSAVSLGYSSSNNEEFYIMTPSADITVTLPSISGNSIPEGYKVNVKNLSASNTLTLSPNSTGSNKIDGSTSITHSISTQYENITLVCDGSDTWYRV